LAGRQILKGNAEREDHDVSPFILEIQRAFVLIRIAGKYGVGPLLRRVLHMAPRGPTVGVRLRLAFEELGITYLKFGQFLTMRFDVLPAEICAELNKLFESVPAMSFAEAAQVVESELGAPLAQLFPVFSRDPIAAASIAQVHVAYSAAKEKLAVKVQRVGIDRLFSADMRILARLAWIIDALGIAGEFSARGIAGQFGAWTEREMDFETEGRTAERLRKNAAHFEIIPRIYWSLTSRKVLTMEFIEGVSLAKIGDMVDAGREDLLAQALSDLDVPLVGQRIAFAVLRQLFVFGFFQGDPHPGNILICEDNRIAFVDFGIFGELSETYRENMAGFLENLALGNIELSFYYYSRQHTPTAETDMKAFEREAKAILRLWYETSANPFATPIQRHMGRYATAMIEAIRRHRLRSDPNVLLWWRAIYALDTSSERLSKYFDMLGQVRAFFIRFRPGLAGRVAQVVGDGNRNMALLRLARDGSQRIENVFINLTGSSASWPVEENESAKERIVRNRRTRWVALALIAVSLAVAARSPYLRISFRDHLHLEDGDCARHSCFTAR
jgi:ubiquinone biosynthesis protein